MTKPNWKPIQIRLGDLIPWGDNPKYSTREDAKRLIETEQEFGQFQTFSISPFMDGGKVNCYDGHQRDSAWRTAYGDDFVVWALQSDRHLTEAERRRFVLRAHNAHGQWSSDILLGWPADELTGGWFNSATLNTWKADVNWLGEFLKSEAPAVDAEPQVDRAAELLEKWQVKPGDLWQIGEHRLICGDCTDAATVARVMDGQRAGCSVTDPPYGQNQIDVTGDEPESNSELLRDCVAQIPIDNGIVIAFESPRLFPNWMEAISNHKFLRALWLYKEAQMANPWRGWILKSEMILISEIGDGEWLDVHPFAHDCYKLSEVSYRTEKIAPMRPHGSVKPLSVVQDLVSRIGGDVYEPFCGSGTTMVACQNLERKCRAIEIDPAYVAVALERMSTAFPALDIRRLDAGG